MLLRELTARLPDLELRGDPDTIISGIAYDSRAVEKGSLFVGIRGEKTDGALFLDQARERGAAAFATEGRLPPHLGIPALKVPDARLFLAEAARIFFGDPASELELAAITGTNGKTTTSYLIESVFRGSGLKACLLGTIGMKVGARLFPAHRTTPEASDLMAFLRQAVDAGCTHGALEVSSHALALKRVYGARFAVGIFTNLTPDHLDFHKDMESYYRAKRLLFVPEGANRIDWAVINMDDPYGRRLSAEVSCQLVRYGFSADTDIRVVSHESRLDGTCLHLTTPRGDLELCSQLVGRPNIYNTMAAVGASLCLGIDPEFIRKGIGNLPGVPGRMELVDAGQPFTVIVDYAHTPDALKKLLETLAALPHASIITVFGCGGDRDRTKRPVMGEIAGQMSSFVIATSDNPRSEDSLAILEAIEAGLKKARGRYQLIADRRKAIESAVSMARKGDVVVIAGKGHEGYQIVGAESHPFDDRLVARELILGLPGRPRSTELK
jgi:UDP-N-acetylmuramoyl-L-alanyl-D-glutamate--2,6-diaminopimelate ligase